MIPAGKTSASASLETIADVYRFFARAAFSMNEPDCDFWDDTFVANAWERISQFALDRAVPMDGLKLDSKTAKAMVEHGKDPDKIDVAGFDAHVDAGMDAAHIVAAMKDVESAVKRLPEDARATAIKAIYSAFEAGMWSGSYLLRFHVDAPAARGHQKLADLKGGREVKNAPHRANHRAILESIQNRLDDDPKSSKVSVFEKVAHEFKLVPGTIKRIYYDAQKK